MVKPILIANWKNHPSSLFEAKKLLKALSRSSRIYKKWDFFIAPPLVYFESVAGSFASLASQDVEFIELLKSFGVRLAIIGHSDRRKLGDTNEIVNNKFKAALRAGFVPLLCVGEPSRDSDGEHFEFIKEQIRLALTGVKKDKNFIIAYEPVWAIGKSFKDSIEPEELRQTVIFIKKVLADVLGRKAGAKVKILYGGAVEPANAGKLMKGTGIKGFLVGHASLDAKKFKAIAESIL